MRLAVAIYLLFLPHIWSTTYGQQTTLNQNMTVTDGQIIGTIIGQVGSGQVAGWTPDAGPPYQIFATPADSSVISVTQGGQVSVIGQIVRQQKAVYQFLAVSPTNVWILVYIYVIPASNVSPVFNPPSVNISIPESAPLSALFALSQVSQPVTGTGNSSVMRCSILSGNTNNVFQLVTSAVGVSGALSVQLGLTATLDFESVKIYNLIIRAYDVSTPPRFGSMQVMVYVTDANDNAPVFNSSIYVASIPENSAIGRNVVRVFASDADSSSNGRVSYSIDGQQNFGSSDFSIDPTTGVVSVARRLNFTVRRSYSLLVVARDGGSVALQATVVVSIEVTRVVTSTPVVQLVFLSDDGSASILKSASTGDFVAQVSIINPISTNPSSVDIALIGGDGHFRLLRSGTTIYLMVVAESLDDAASSYAMAIVVTVDGNRVTKNFTLSVVPDSSPSGPSFLQSSYYAEIQEIAIPGTSVLQVSVVGGTRNAQYAFRIRGHSGSRSQWFSIGISSGLIVTGATFDCLTVGDYSFNVTASEIGARRLVSFSTAVIVRVRSVSRHPPYFSYPFYSVAVAENSPLLTCILQVAAKAEGCGANSVRYDVATGTVLGSLPFAVDSVTGNICVSEPLNYASRSTYEFNVTAIDNAGYTAVSLVQFNVQPFYTRSPVLSATFYSAYMDVNASPGVAVVAVSATNYNPLSTLSYHIVGGNLGSVFFMNPSTGLILLKRPLALQLRNFNLSVYAVDSNGVSSDFNAIVMVTVYNSSSEPRPLFASQLYAFSVLENVTKGSYIGVVNTIIGSPVRYSIIQSSVPSPNMFSIDQQSGQISAGAVPVSSKFTPFVLLTVRAELERNSSLFNLCQVNLTIVDVNNHSPVFGTPSAQVFVREDAPIGLMVYLARATDEDTQQNGRVLYSIDSNTFSINNQSGVVTLSRRLDYELIQRYIVTITAADFGSQSRMAIFSLVISVLDVNDVAPVFSSPIYSFDAVLPLPFGALIGTVRATNNQTSLTYFLRNGRFNDLFDVRADSGDIFSRTVFDSNAQSRYNLQIVVTDDGVPALSSTATVLLTLNRPTSNVAPAFSSTQYVFNVTEGLPSETSVGKVAVVGVSQPEFYANAQKFTVVKNTGEILTKGVLDCEDGIVHEFSVGVVGQPLLVVFVTVRVLGVNEHAPAFISSLPSVVNIAENQPTGSRVVQVVATDLDIGSDGQISYLFAPDNHEYFSDHFVIDEASGLITTRQVLQHHASPEFTLKILAQDHGSPPLLSSPLILTVYIGPSGPADSLRYLSSVSFVVPENADVGAVIGYVDSVSLDSSKENNYYIVRGNTFGSFAINCTNGNLIVASPLRYEDCPLYFVTVQVISTDPLTPPIYTILVNVSIVSVFLTVPEFDSELVFVSVRENLPIGSGITSVSATYGGERGVLKYSIVSQIPNGTWFTIDPDTGFMKTAAGIDREKVEQIAITILATPRSMQGLPVHFGNSTAMIVAVVTDANDNVPTFDRVNPAVNVSEDEALGFPVLTVLAYDPDLGNNGQVKYALLAGNDDGHFLLDTSTGVLSVVRSLDRETTSRYVLNISATDCGVPSLSSVMVLTIVVCDVNDNPPVFVQSMYNVYILENQPPGSSVVTVSATDFDDPTTMNTQLTYSIPNGVAGNNFQINSSTGAVTTKSLLDREARSSWIITVYVHNAGYPAFYDTTTVNVVVLDVNDNPPMFATTTGSLTLSIPENANMGVVHTVEAYDADTGSNGQVSYYISGGNVDNRFYVDPSTGRLSCTPLDRELVATYNLSIVATDQGVPELSAVTHINVVVIDDNDNDPLFQQLHYSASIYENTPIGTVILTLQAVDLDEGLNGNVSYSLSNAADGIFDVNPQTGVVTLIMSPDYESVTAFSIDAQSTDACPYGPRSRSVRVDINILDVNDNSPVFSENIYHTDIVVGFPVNGLVATVVASDADSRSNSRLSYSLVDASQYFQIDPTSGAVTTRRLLEISTVGVQSLKVMAIDSGSPPKNSTCVVLVNIGLVTQTSSGLRFANHTYIAYVLEHSAPGTVVLAVTAQVNGSSLATYGLAYGDNIFDIDPRTGVITVADSAALDRETSERVRVVAFATTAAGAYDYATVWINVLDINDNRPRFLQERYQSKVWENSLRGTFVAQVIASDDDPDSGPNGQIEYYIVSGNLQSAFDISPPSTGIVKTNIILDREVIASYRLEIAAVDQGNPPRSSTVVMRIQVIDINDNSPFFPPYSPVSVREATMVGTVLLQVTATDVDLNPSLTYSLNTANDTFAVDKYSGMISVVRPLDYETCTAYNLSVIVYDEGKAHSAVTTVPVYILDDNDNAPVFTQTSYAVLVNELTGPGSYIMTVNATDRDTGQNGRVSYSLLPVDSFYINSTTGAVFTNKLLVFNPLQPVIFLVVSATDLGNPSMSTTIAVEIQVVDVNDHAPLFAWSYYSASVSENAAVGTSVVHLIATDADYTYDNTKLDYYIVAGNNNDTFAIAENLNSVDIVLVSALDRELISSYSLSIVVIDNGLPPLSGSAQVNISVLDYNDVAPVFDAASYNVSISENITVGTRFLTVHAVDSDLGDAGRVAYEIVSGDGTDYFSIDGNSGTLSVRLALDYETKTSYSLVVMAVDNGPITRLTVYTEVNIDLLDVNEYKPSFPKLIYIEHVLTNQPPGTFVCNAEAPDRDAGPYGVVRYQLVPISGNYSGTFVIDADSGCVYTGVTFGNSSAGSGFSFRILATDAGGFEVTAGLLITVQQPLAFPRSKYQFNVHGSAQVGDKIGRVQVDTVATWGDAVEYYLQPRDEYFDIGSATGVIFVIKNLRGKSSSPAGNTGRRRRQSVDTTTVSLNVVARARGRETSVVVMINLNWTACCYEIPPAASTVSPITSGRVSSLPITSLLFSASPTLSGSGAATGGSSALSGTPLVVLIVIISVAVIIIGVVVIVCLHRRRRRRRNKSPPNGAGDYGASTIESSSLETFDVPPPAFGGFRPPSYHQAKFVNADIGYYAARNVNVTTSEMTGEDDGAESSGRGSAEKNPGDDLDDDEIRIINAVMSEIGGGTGVAYSQLRRARVPDSGIQPDHEDDAESESSSRDRAYLTRLGVDAGSSGRVAMSKVVGGLMPRRGQSSVESIHQFSEEGGGEAAMPDDSSIADRRYSDGENSSSSRSHRERSAPVVDAEEVFSSSFNWDYLLDWKPEYRPLADVFAEIARLPDEKASTRQRVAKTCPTQIVPQRSANQRQNAVPVRSLRNGPPPIITNVPPLAVKTGADLSADETTSGPISSGRCGSLSSTGSSASSNRRMPLSMPPSTALTYQSSFNSAPMLPSQTPSMSPLVPGSPSVSPLDQSIVLHQLPPFSAGVNHYRNNASGLSQDVGRRRGQRNPASYDSKEIEI